MQYKNTYKCKKCSALLGIGRWCTGYYDGGTSNSFRATGIIPAGHCPICRTQMKFGLWFWDDLNS